VNDKRKMDGTLLLEITTEFPMEPASCVISYVGKISLSTGEGTYDVGSVSYHHVLMFDMLASGADPFFELDGLSEETSDFCEFIDDDRNGWSQKVLTALPYAEFGDLVVIGQLVVYPPFRGLDIGLLCLGTLVRLIKGAALFALRPKPLQYTDILRGDPRLAKKAGNKRVHVRKLMAYYARGGFKEIPGTGRMALDPSVKGPMDERGDSWAHVTLTWSPTMNAYLPPAAQRGVEKE
jgi:hypothetical protein